MISRPTDNQLRYILAERFTENSFPIPVTFRFAGRIDPARLDEAISTVIGRHAVLKSRFRFVGENYVTEPAAGPVSHRSNIRNLARWDEDAARRRMIAHFYAPVPHFAPDTLIRSQVIFVGADEDESVVTLSLHHAISDGVSTAIFIRDVFDAYSGRPVAPGADYADIAAQMPLDLQAGRAFWAEYLAGMEPASVAHDLRADIPLAERKPVRITLPLDALRKTAGALRARPFHVAAALTALLYQKTTGRSDAAFTYQSAGRRLVPADMKVIGPFSNTIVMRLDTARHADFPALVAAAANALRETRAHEFYPRRQILSEFNAETPFGVNFYPRSPKPDVAGLRFIDRLFLYRETDFDLDLRFERLATTFRLYLFFNPEKYSARLIEGIAGEFRDLLERAARNPHASLAGLLPPRPAPARAVMPAMRPARLFDAFLAAAGAHPDRLALADRGERLTYADVARESAAVAAQLGAAGLGPGARVAIYAERTARHVVNLLGVFRSGAIAVPLDSDYPGDRLAALIDVARPDGLLAARPLDAADWAGAIPRHLTADPHFPAAPAPRPDARAPAYILFTSGSTGRPKGVATSHLPIVRFLDWERETFRITPDDRFSNLNGLAHDMIMRDIFAPLSVGAALHIPEQEEIFIPGGLARWCAEVKPTFVHLTPAMAQMILAGMEPGSLASIRTMIFGGDRLLPELTRQLYAAIPGVEIINFYGATETPQAATWHRCSDGVPYRAQPIGRGVPGVTAEIVGADRLPVWNGVVGEIAITSPFLSLGYVVDGELRPHADPDVYHTGDQGFVLPDGDIMFVGRKDDQVSIRGARVELGEIAAALKREDGVEDAAVLMENPENPRLVAFVVGEGLEARALRAELSRKLPRYMTPADIVLLDALPLLPNGKLDRRRMLKLPRRKEGDAGAPPGDATAKERELIDAWAKVLGQSDIHVGRSFADLGGDSLNHVQAYLVAERVLGAVPDGWDAMSIRELVKADAAAPVGFLGRILTTIESTMLTRAVAIALIVGLHLEVFSYGGGGTTALMLVSGVLMARTRVAQAYITQSAKPMRDLFFRVFWPCALFAWAYTAAKLLLGMPVYWQVPALVVNFVDFSADGVAGQGGWPVYLWYVSALLQIFLLLYIFTRFNMKRQWLRTPEAFAAFLFAFGCFARFVLPGLLDPGFWTKGLTVFSIMGRMPTAHIGTIALGVLIGLHRGHRQRRKWIALIVIAYAGLTDHISPTNEDIMLLFFGLLMVFVQRLPTIRGLSIVILGISGASLFIYLTQMQFARAWILVGVSEGSPLLWAVTIISGMLCWVGWQYAKPVARTIREKGFLSPPGRRGISRSREMR